MKRRTFLQSLTAAAATPLMPLKALAATAATTSATFEQPYLWASFISRVHNKSSPAMLQRLLKLDADTAGTVYKELLANNVISPPNALGLSQATNPFPQATMLNSPVSTAVQPSSTQKQSVSVKQQSETSNVQKPAGAIEEDSSSVNQEVTASLDEQPMQDHPTASDASDPKEGQSDKPRQG